MSHWRIQQRMVFVVLAPVLLTALILMSYIAWQRFAGLSDQLQARANVLAQQFSVSVEPFMHAADAAAQLQRLAATLLADSDVAAVQVTDATGTTLMAQRAASGSHADVLVGRAMLARPASTIATVQVELTRAHAMRRAWREVAVLAAFSLLCIAGAVWMARRYGRELSTPIARMTSAVDALAAGKLDARVPPQSSPEFTQLEQGINDMASKLQASQDVLQRRVSEATASLLAQKEEAERANIAKSRFLAAASHDLRQPMHALTLFVEDLKQRISYPEVSRIVHNIEASVNAMGQLFNALLDISRLDAGVLQAHPVDFPVERLLDRVRTEFEPAAREKGLRFKVVASRLIVRADPVLCERILKNLVANAVRYTSRGGVVVGSRRHGDTVRLEVWDSGSGIALERQRDVFQEFYQLGNPERDRSKGLGLGLAIVERMAKLMGSRVRLRSIVNKGSVFSFAVARSPHTELPRDRSPAVESARADALADVLVVVIDDEAPILEGMRGLLAGWGCDVIAAESKAAAAQQLQERATVPSVIISDYRLRNDENGIDVIRGLRADFGGEIPGVLVTGDTAPDRLRDAQLSGFYLIHKPVRPAKLRTLLTHLIAQSRQVDVA